jgi:hypothetical protein
MGGKLSTKLCITKQIFIFFNHRKLGDVAVFENRQPVTAAKFINKCSLFILLLGVIRRLELKHNSEQKAENTFVAPPYYQTECCRHGIRQPDFINAQTILIINLS